MIETIELWKKYGDFEALKGVSLSVERGEVFGFLGPNGAGKTTTILLLMGILVPSSGTARVAGFDCFRERVEVKRRVGYLPDNPLFYDFLRGREVLEFTGRMHGLSKREARQKAGDLLTVWGLAQDAEEFAVNYSTGMRKKLALACALIHQPDVLILDEPTNGLDPRASREVQERLKTLAGAGKTIFLSTHLLDMAEKICSRLGIIHKGELVMAGRLEELKERTVPGGTLEKVFLDVTKSEGQEETSETPSPAPQGEILNTQPGNGLDRGPNP